ncbi:MAG: pyridoxamine 5'-phosphate oxidase [Burkholderiales bacterium]
MKISDIRQEYMRAGLAEADARADPFAQFDRWFKDALAANLPLANAMTLATVTAGGGPDARVVLLKGVDGGGFVFYTNYESRKGRQLAARPQACLVFLWSPLERQIRIEGGIEKVSAAESDAYFASRPLGARQSACASAQSEIVPNREYLETRVKAVGDTPPRPANWGGYRLKPTRIEFWQGRENRLHDRLLYRADKGAWKIERLAP